MKPFDPNDYVLPASDIEAAGKAVMAAIIGEFDGVNEYDWCRSMHRRIDALDQVALEGGVPSHWTGRLSDWNDLRAESGLPPIELSPPSTASRSTSRRRA